MAGAVHRFTIDPALADALEAVARARAVPRSVVLIAGLVALLHRYTGQTEPPIRLAMADHPPDAVTAPALRIDVGGDPTFAELLRRVGLELLGQPGGSALGDEQLIGARTPPGGPPVVLVEHGADVEEATAANLATHLAVLLTAAASRPDAPVSTLPLLDRAERQRVVVEWNDTARPYPRQATIHELVCQQVDASPDARAVVFEGTELTYGQLDRRANQLANHLQSLGAGPGMLVGVCLERSIEMVVALLAVLKAGAAYLPLEPSDPRDRLEFMLQDALVPILLSAEGLVPHPLQGVRQVLIDADWAVVAKEPDVPPCESSDADDLAYVIYTSGSTGRPKGVAVPHRGVVNRLVWMQDAYAIDATDVVLQKTPFSFDVSVWELFWPLMTGACLVVARPHGHRDPRYLVDVIRRTGVTTLHMVPSMLGAFLDQPAAATCRSLRRVICSGEALTERQQRRFFGALPCSLHNLYGPTEASIDVTAWTCRDDGRTPPIGRPIANTRIYVLDEHLEPVPVGVAGELCIAGDGLARGYLHRQDLTASAFVPDPFSDELGARLYRTGDLARFLPDGNLAFLGRLDHQVKVRGYRIELGEVEAVLAACPGIKEAVVVARDEASGDRRLVAHLVACDPEPSATDVRRHVRQVLPRHMWPSAYVFVDALPMTPNGKVDRRRLCAPVAPSGARSSRTKEGA